MAKTRLTKDSEFIVGEDRALVYIMALLFFGLFMYGLVDAILKKMTNLGYLNYVFILAAVPATLFFIKGFKKRIYIRVNKKGIYQDEQLLTTWPNFLNAYISQEEKLISIQDNFILVVEYRKDSSNKGYRRKVPLTNTQNRSEEEVLEAVNYFWRLYNNG